MLKNWNGLEQIHPGGEIMDTVTDIHPGGESIETVTNLHPGCKKKSDFANIHPRGEILSSPGVVVTVDKRLHHALDRDFGQVDGHPGV